MTEFDKWFNNYKLKGYEYEVNYLSYPLNDDLPEFDITIKFRDDIIHNENNTEVVNVVKDTCISHQRHIKLKELGI